MPTAKVLVVDDHTDSRTICEIILARNPNTALERLGQTSIFRFPVGKLLPLQEKFLADPQAVADTYQFEQRYVTREAPGGIRFWPAPWVRHFRFHCARPLPLNFFLERYTESFVAELRAFVDAVLRDLPVPVTGADARAPVVMGLAARKSYDEHRPVRLSEVAE